MGVTFGVSAAASNAHHPYRFRDRCRIRLAAASVESLARPGGNSTGFSPWEYGIGAK
jgi:hypothetical protein